MTDEEILSLYEQRNEAAIRETERKYGSYCRAIAENVLANREDAQEVVNDAYLRLWNAIPPERPRILAQFLGKLTRDLAIDRWRKNTSQKRGGSQVPLALEELRDCISGGESLETTVERQELTRILQDFLMTLSPQERNVFLCRYWYLDSIPEIAAFFQFSKGKVTSMLYRTRRKLARYLKEGGYFDE